MSEQESAPDRMLRWFDYKQPMPPEMAVFVMVYNHLAKVICDNIEASPERTVALRKLLESKDAAIRAMM